MEGASPPLQVSLQGEDLERVPWEGRRSREARSSQLCPGPGIMEASVSHFPKHGRVPGAIQPPPPPSKKLQPSSERNTKATRHLPGRQFLPPKNTMHFSVHSSLLLALSVKAFSVLYMDVLVSQGCQNKIPQARWLKQQQCPVSQFWRQEVQNQGISSLGSF